MICALRCDAEAPENMFSRKQQTNLSVDHNCDTVSLSRLYCICFRSNDRRLAARKARVPQGPWRSSTLMCKFASVAEPYYRCPALTYKAMQGRTSAEAIPLLLQTQSRGPQLQCRPSSDTEDLAAEELWAAHPVMGSIVSQSLVSLPRPVPRTIWQHRRSERSPAQPLWPDRSQQPARCTACSAEQAPAMERVQHGKYNTAEHECRAHLNWIRHQPRVLVADKVLRCADRACQRNMAWMVVLPNFAACWHWHASTL